MEEWKLEHLRGVKCEVDLLRDKRDKATVMIDGLDDLDISFPHLLDSLNYLVDNSSSVLKVFVSSQEDATIALRSQHVTFIRVTSADTSKDIAML